MGSCNFEILKLGDWEIFAKLSPSHYFEIASKSQR